MNAADEMPESGALVIECSEVSLDGPAAAAADLRPDRYLLITVSDSGVGLPAETLPRIFEPFYTTRSKARGSGLGLPTAYGIVRQSGGHIVATSEPGRGTTFRIHLPLATEGEDAPQPAPARFTRAVAPERQTILIAEDDEGVRRFATELLRGEGYDVLVPTTVRRRCSWPATAGDASIWC